MQRHPFDEEICLTNKREGNVCAAKRVAHRVGAVRNEWLDELRERIKTRARGKRWRQFTRQFRIDQRNARKHERAAQAHFHTMFG